MLSFNKILCIIFERRLRRPEDQTLSGAVGDPGGATSKDFPQKKDGPATYARLKGIAGPSVISRSLEGVRP